MGNKVSIVVPCYNHYDLLHSLLFDIYNFNRDVDEVVIIDNGSNAKDFFDGYNWWLKSKNLPLKMYTIKENVGFLKACNFGVPKADGDIILLVSNDVQIKRPILDEVKEKLNGGNCIVGPRLVDWNSGWNCFNNHIYPYLEGWLLGFTRGTWKDLGGFDERFAPNDYEDVDFSTSAISKGYSLVTLGNSQITHLGGATLKFSPQREALTKINQEKFRQKWVK